MAVSLSMYLRRGSKMKEKKNRMRILTGILVIALSFSSVAYYLKTENDKQKEIDKINNNASMIADAPEDKQQYTESKHGYAVSTANGLATEVGMKILENGGNAVDAAVAIAYTLGVVQPQASGIGGGGGMLIYDPEADKYTFLDYREISSSNFSTDICIPGFVAGMDYANEKYGTMDMADLIEPAYRMASEGFVIGDYLDYDISRYEDLLSSYDVFLQNGSIVELGDTWVQPDLAETMKKIMDDGAEEFYSGELGREFSASAGISSEEWAAYKVEERVPVTGKFSGMDVISAPAPFSGTTVIQMLEMAEKIDIADAANQNEYLAEFKNITDIAYSDRVRNNADPAFYSNDELSRTTEVYISDLLNKNNVTYENEEESMDTTHFSIIDSNGMVVSGTHTLCSFWGSKQRINGVFLNNGGTHFGTGINEREAGKRARNFTAPVILTDGDYVMAIGSPGGNYIPKILVPILIDVFRNGTSLEDAIQRGRIAFTYDGLLEIEENVDSQWMIDPDKVDGYSIIWSDYLNLWGAVETVGYSSDTGLFAISDHRISGDAVIENNR